MSFKFCINCSDFDNNKSDWQCRIHFLFSTGPAHSQHIIPESRPPFCFLPFLLSPPHYSISHNTSFTFLSYPSTQCSFLIGYLRPPETPKQYWDLTKIIFARWQEVGHVGQYTSSPRSSKDWRDRTHQQTLLSVIHASRNAVQRRSL